MIQRQDSIKLNRNDPDSLYYWIANKISSYEFRNIIKKFIDEKCDIFLDDNEQSFQHGQIFNSMNLLIEKQLKSILEEGNITEEDYKNASERGKTDVKYKKYFNQIEKFKQYPFFKSVMVKRNKEMMLMAEKQMNRMTPNQIDNNNEQKIDLTPELLSKLFENDNEIKKVMKKSYNREEKRKIEVTNNEEEDMKIAIKQSLEQYKKEQEQREKQKKQSKKMDPINSIIGFEISEEDSSIKNRLEIKNIQNIGKESKINSIKEENINNEKNNNIYDSTMPAPAFDFHIAKQAQNNETLKKNRLVENNIYQIPKNENIYNSPRKIEPKSFEPILENSYKNSYEEDFKNNHNENDDNNNKRIFYLPDSYNENIPEYNNGNQEKEDYTKKVLKLEKKESEQKMTNI